MNSLIVGRRSHVYLDMPNILYKEDGVLRSPHLEVLLADIVRSAAEGTILKTVVFYIQAEDPQDDQYHALAQKLADAGIEASITRSPRRKDIDSLLIDDLWFNATRYIERGKSKERRMRHIIVSGDSGYIRTCLRMQSAFGFTGTDIQYALYSWRDKCSGGWKQVTDRIHYLDDIPHIKAR